MSDEEMNSDQVTFGERLKQARESKRMTEEEVAAQLRLRTTHIINIENDEYDSLPGQAYICGYLRAYGRLVDIPEDEIATEVNKLGFNWSEKLKPVNYISQTGPTSNHRLLIWASIVGFMMLIIFVSMFWRHQHSNSVTQVGHDVDAQSQAPTISVTTTSTTKPKT